MPKPPPEWMQKLNELLAEDPTTWTIEQQAAYLRESGSLLEALLDLQLRVQSAGVQDLSHLADTVGTTEG